MDIFDILLKVVYALCMISVVMGLSAYAVLAERKVASWIQERPGPNRTAVPIVRYLPVIGPLLIRLGLMQPVADGLKFFFKEEIIPGHVHKFYFHLAPCLVFIPTMLIMTVMPIGIYNGEPLMLANIDLGILLIFAISSLGVYGVILAGWSSNSKYPFLGGVRATAQMISYELALGLSVLTVFMWSNSPGEYHGFSLVNVVQYQENHVWFILVQPLQALIFLTALFAETNRLPFDMPEAETELVSGYNTEYGCFKFGLFFVAEYAHIILGSALFVVLFLGGWDVIPIFETGFPKGFGIIPNYDLPAGTFPALLSVIVFLGKVFCLVIFFMWIRWTLPRFRYDQVMMLGWKTLLPLSLALVIIYAFGIAILQTLNLI